jgi:hypothetical protein
MVSCADRFGVQLVQSNEVGLGVFPKDQGDVPECVLEALEPGRKVVKLALLERLSQV